jgi:hypothetical protein
MVALAESDSVRDDAVGFLDWVWCCDLAVATEVAAVAEEDDAVVFLCGRFGAEVAVAEVGVLFSTLVLA